MTAAMFETGMLMGTRHRDDPRLAAASTVVMYPHHGVATPWMRTTSVIGEIKAGGQMTDGEGRRSGERRSSAAVELRIAAQLENLAVLRTVVGAVGTFSDLDFDAVADLRLAVDEACTRLIRSATPDATLVVVVDPRDDVVVVEASTTCDTYDVVTEGSFSWHVLSSLTDELKTFHNGSSAGHEANPAGRVFGITLTTRRAGFTQ
jgi:anti-sigma regulatory factor (Ser/Thr protein kinase)